MTYLSKTEPSKRQTFHYYPCDLELVILVGQGELKWGPYFPQSLSIALGICFDLLKFSLEQSLSQKNSILEIKNVPRPDFYST